MADYYILVGQTPVPCELMEWAEWFERGPEERRVKVTTVMGSVLVSTVFLGIDHSFGGRRPLLFETMAFWNGKAGYEQERCSTWQEAEAQHEAMVREVARPASVWAYCLRSIGEWEAVQDWRREWKRLRGIEPSTLEKATERMRDLLREG